MKRLMGKFLLISASLFLMAPSLEAAQKLKMSTIAPGSSAYLVMTTMATIVNQGQDNFEIKVDATGAATKHMIELAQGKMDICMTSPVVYFLMKGQKAMYQKLKTAPELAKNLNLIFWFSLGQYHVVTYAESGIRSAEDIRGKRVFLGPPGGGAWNAKTSPGAKKFAEHYKEVSGEDMGNYWGSLYFYSAMQHFKQAVEQAGTLNQKKIRVIMATEKYDTALGTYGYDERRISMNHPGEIGQWQNGVFEVIDRGAKRTAPPIAKLPWPKK